MDFIFFLCTFCCHRMVRIILNFSERNRLEPVKFKFQKDEVDQALRVRLWNILDRYYWGRADQDVFYSHNVLGEIVSNRILPLALKIQERYFIQPIDRMGYSWNDYRESIRNRFFSCKWNKIYDFIEFLISTKFVNIHNRVWQGNQAISFFDEINQALEREQSAYRLVGEQFAPITDKVEEYAVNSTLSYSNPYAIVHEHIKKAVKLLSDRENPDYRNSIKESISAVEAVCRIITGDTHATLGSALKKLEEHNIVLHKAFKESMLKMYGYTSDEGGIRHCLTDASNVDFADAKYMLVSCSAFCNFLIDKSKENLGR